MRLVGTHVPTMYYDTECLREERQSLGAMMQAPLEITINT